MVGIVAMVTVLTLDLDGNDAPPFKNEVASFQVLIGGTAELNVHLLIETNSNQSQENHRKQVHHFSH